MDAGRHAHADLAALTMLATLLQHFLNDHFASNAHEGYVSWEKAETIRKMVSSPRRRRGQRNSTSAGVIAAVRQLVLIANDDFEH